jgi:hypothetical protein
MNTKTNNFGIQLISTEPNTGERTSDELRREILDRMNYFYRKTDGSMNFPNSCEGDLLKMIHKFLYQPSNEY